MISSPSLNPGRFDRRVALRYPQASRNAIGESVDAWVQSGRVWAQWLPAGSREFFAAKSRHSEATGLIRIRHRADLDSTWRLLMGDDYFEILGIVEVGRREYLEISVRAVDQTVGTSLVEQISAALDAVFSAAALAIKGAFSGGAIEATATAAASPSKDAAAAAPLAAAAELVAAPSKGAAIASALAATADSAVAQRGVSNQRLTSDSDRRVTASGDVRVVYEYA